MTNNSIILLNDIILKIHTIKEFEEMRKTLMSSLRFLIPCFGNVFYLASGSESYRLTKGICTGLSEECMNIYLKEFQDYDQTTWSYATPYAKAYHESAFIQSEASQNSDFFNRVYGPQNIYFQVALTIIHNGIFLGVIALFRTKEEADFRQDELFILELLAAHLGVRLYQNFQLAPSMRSSHPNLEILLNQYRLTLRETEIFYAMLNENEKMKICSDLCISPNTYKKHVLHLYKKLGVSNRIELYQTANRMETIRQQAESM